MATIGKLAVQITADATGLQSGLKSAETSVGTFNTKATALLDKLSLIGTAAILAGGALGVTLLRNVANTADELAKLSQKTGVAVEDLSRLQYAADLSGISGEQLGGAITRLSRSMSDVAQGTGEAGDAFTAMGISVKNTDGTLRLQKDVLDDIADRFASYQDGAEKSALAQKIFGRAGADLIPLLNSGADGLKDMADESDRLGNTIDTNTAKAAEKLNDNITRLETGLGGIARVIGSSLIPELNKLTDEFLTGIQLAGGFWNALAVFGTINPFRDLQGNLQSTRSEIDSLTAAHKRYTEAGSDTSAIDQALATEKLRLEYLKSIERQQAINAQSASDQSAAEAKRLGLSAGASPTAAPAMETEEQKRAKEEAKKKAEKDAEEAKKRAQEVEDFFAKVDTAASQREMDKMTAFMEALKIREDARLQEGMTEQQRAEKQHAKELEQLLASKEALALTEEEFSARLLQIRYDRDTKIMDADLAMLDRERQIADERVRINKQAEQLITNAREASANAAVGLLSALGGKSKAAAVAAIALGKALSIAQIIQHTAVAQMHALAQLGPVAGAAAAAKIAFMGKVQMGLVAATGLVQAAGVMSGGTQSLSASGTVQSAASSSSANAMQPGMAAPVTNQTITVQGIGSDALFSGDAVRTLIDRLIDAQRNGARIVLA